MEKLATEQDDLGENILNPSMLGGQQNAELLRYILDTNDPIDSLQRELEGKELRLTDDDKVIVEQTRAPLINPSLRNSIFGFLRSYVSKNFITTKIDDKEINRITGDVGKAVVDVIKNSQRYSSVNWKQDETYLSESPAFLKGKQQPILLLIEHTIFITLKRSKDGMTLDKVTGVHSSQTLQTSSGEQKKRGLLASAANMFK